jgi:hypothetical protein
MSKDDLPPLTDKDFYLNEEGFMVFTRAYHLKRGFCCKSGCLHCPWGFKREKKVGVSASE